MNIVRRALGAALLATGLAAPAYAQAPAAFPGTRPVTCWRRR